jgi:hypothetical protein
MNKYEQTWIISGIWIAAGIILGLLCFISSNLISKYIVKYRKNSNCNETVEKLQKDLRLTKLDHLTTLGELQNAAMEIKQLKDELQKYKTNNKIIELRKAGDALALEALKDLPNSSVIFAAETWRKTRCE